jgi:hypothetical protein
MNGFAIPITMTSRFVGENNTKKVKDSIDDFIELIVFSANGSFKADYYFGFVFQNTKFQNSDQNNQIEEKKIIGESQNKNNYAHELKMAIEEYETRINNVRVIINYDTNKKMVSIDVSGQYEEDFTEKNYTKNITFYIW